jgi:hypothetical protein
VVKLSQTLDQTAGVSRTLANQLLRGRSRTLRVNYRTSHQIRLQADRLLGPAVHRWQTEERAHTVFVFNGPPPDIRVLKSQDEETKRGGWLSDRMKAGIAPHEFGVFVRSEAELDRAKAAVQDPG